MKTYHKTGTLFLSFLLFLSGLYAGNTPWPFALKASCALAAEPGKANWQQKWGDMVAAAKKEGNLAVYTTANGADVRKTSAAFTEKYGIKVDVLSARGPELVQKMETQRSAGMSAVDIVIAGGTNLVFLMKPKGYLDKLDEILMLPEVTDPKVWISGSLPYIDKDHYALNIVAAFTRPLIKNTALVKEGEINSYKDLTNSRWKGKIVLNDPTIPGGGNSVMAFLASVWGIEGTKEYLRQLMKQDLVVTRDPRQQVEWAARGKYEIALGTNGEVVGEFIKLGAPIYPVIAAEGGEINSLTYGLGIVNKRPNPHAAAVYANWVMSKEGHAVLTKNARVPGSRVDSPREGIPAIFYPQPGEKFYVATEESFKRQQELLKVAADVLGPILK